MNRHPVPQNIMDVEFKLFGAFTVRQFSQLSANLIIGLVIYLTPLPVVVKWPLIIFFVIIGFSMAMMTVNGLPFSTWLFNFIDAVTSSQKRVWKKSPKVPEYLKGQTPVQGKYSTHIVSKSYKDLRNMPLLDPNMTKAADELDREENGRLGSLDMHLKRNFSETEFQKRKEYKNQIPIGLTPSVSPVINTKQEGLAINTNLNNPNTIPIKMGDNTTAAFNVIKSENINRPMNMNPTRPSSLYNPVEPPVQSVPPVTTPQPEIIQPTIPAISPNTEKKVEEQIIAPPVSNTIEDQKMKELTRQIEMLQGQLNELKPKIDDQSLSVQTDISKKIDAIYDQLKQPEKIEKEEHEVVLSQSPINRPNIISGLVVSIDDQPIEGVSIEIKDENNFPIRKITTDNKGQFIFTTPLPNGNYILDFEKPGRHFTDYKINLNGRILPSVKFKEEQ